LASKVGALVRAEDGSLSIGSQGEAPPADQRTHFPRIPQVDIISVDVE
jgi:hypothetical protein